MSIAPIYFPSSQPPPPKAELLHETIRPLIVGDDFVSDFNAGVAVFRQQQIPEELAVAVHLGGASGKLYASYSYTIVNLGPGKDSGIQFQIKVYGTPNP